jgi:hypothetical protein
MLTKIKEFFLGKPKAADPVVEAPYKIETPVTPAVVNPAVFPNVFVDGHGDVQEVKTEAKSKKAPVKKTPVKKPVAAKAPAKPKTPRKPRATK